MRLSDDQIRECQREMAELEQQMVPADLRARGWRYYDIPGRCTPEVWRSLLTTMGHGEYRCIATSEGYDHNGWPWKRGQFFISPQGVENLKALVAAATVST